MKGRFFALLLTAGMAGPLAAQDQPPANPLIDYDGFLALTTDLGPVREARRIPYEQFLAKAGEEGAIILDTRSAAAFAQGHLAGATNLPFSDFTDAKLRRVLGEDRTRPILIYCANNFSDNAAPVETKRAALALNTPTFINLHGYGYTNVWELADVVAVRDVPWVTKDLIGE